MKRRTFNLLTGTSLATLKFGPALAQASGRDPSLLSTTLTPFGAERAGNADGSIPAWTGGYTTLPAGFKPGDYVPDPFPDDQPIVVINAANMAQHADKLSDGVMALMTKYGFSMKVYQTRRTHSLPQSVYDYIKANVTTAKLDPNGPQLGFTNAYGGIPFPIPDIAEPISAGAEIIWNHNHAWYGYAYVYKNHSYAVSSGTSIAVPTAVGIDHLDYPFYRNGGSYETYKGYNYRYWASPFTLPSNIVGAEFVGWISSNPTQTPNITWEILNGQGRVRKAPEIAFDTPSSEADGVAFYDEYQVFEGSLEKYDWKYLGKKEIYIPYNNNKLAGATIHDVHAEHFVNPDLVRWELHRCWVVEATVHPGERHTIPRKMLYVDEDTWLIGLLDGWDANNNLFHVISGFKVIRPDLPGVFYSGTAVHDMQSGNYVTINCMFDEIAYPSVKFYDSLPDDMFDPQNMAASAQY